MDEYFAVLKQYAHFSGRARRKEYWRWWCPKKYADIKRQANNDISIVQNFLLKQRNLANLNY